MLSAFLRINWFRSLAMRASNDRLKMVDSLIHNAILNENYFSIVSIKKSSNPLCLDSKMPESQTLDPRSL